MLCLFTVSLAKGHFLTTEIAVIKSTRNRVRTSDKAVVSSSDNAVVHFFYSTLLYLNSSDVPFYHSMGKAVVSSSGSAVVHYHSTMPH